MGFGSKNKMSVIEARNVTKVFEGEKRVPALDDVSFSVGVDEFLCIVGPSGCGKSTLLRIIAGLEKPTSGEILFHGQPVTGPTPKITMIFQTFGLLPWKTVIENIELPLEIQGVEAESRRETAMRFIREVGLEGFENAYPHDLSGGMKQRVGTARALAVKPEVLLMDEPFSFLDELTAMTLRKEVLDIWNDPNLPTNTFIMVSHNVEEAVFMADRILVMSLRPGRIVGNVEVNIPRPRSRQFRSPAFFEYCDKVISFLEEKKLENKLVDEKKKHQGGRLWK